MLIVVDFSLSSVALGAIMCTGLFVECATAMCFDMSINLMDIIVSLMLKGCLESPQLAALQFAGMPNQCWRLWT